VWLSNSRALERDHGWRGICIEANPYYWVALALKRSCVLVGAAISDSVGQLQFRNPARANRGKAREGGLVGGSFDLKRSNCAETGDCEEFTARTMPMSQVINELDLPARIDYFSLDIEGAEYLAMTSFPFSTYRFSVMTVERPKTNLQELLKKNRYKYVCDHGNFGDQMWIDTTIDLQTEALLVREGKTRVLPFGKNSFAQGRRCDTHEGQPSYRESELGDILKV
jgi:hypothetical protein